MPAYPGSNKAALINTNTQVLLWNAERVLATQASIAVQLERQKSASYPFGASWEVSFNGAPGAFQVDVQMSDTDLDAYFVTVASLSTVNASNVGRVELPNFWAKYTRLRMVTLTNSGVLTTGQVTR
jgi:hypothetical protein